jgi:hypothetical protein
MLTLHLYTLLISIPVHYCVLVTSISWYNCFMCAMVVVQRAEVLPLINQDVPPMASNKGLLYPARPRGLPRAGKINEFKDLFHFRAVVCVLYTAQERG